MSVAPPPIPTRPRSPTPAPKPPPRLTPIERWVISPPPFSRFLLLVLVLLGLLAGVAWGGYVLYQGVEMPLTRQTVFDAHTEQLQTSRVAQSFYVTRPNLDRVDLLVSFVPILDQGGTVQLRDGEGLGGAVLYQAPLSTAKFTSGAYLTVEFPPRPDSQGRTYTIVLDRPGSPLGVVAGVYYSSFDSISKGAMYVNEGSGQPSAGDLAFQTWYRYDIGSLWGDVVRVASELRRLVLSPLLLLLLPGLVMLVWLPNSLSPGQRLLAAPGVTALALPIFYLLTRAVGLKMSGALAWGLLAVCGLALLAGVVRWWTRKPATKLGLKALKFHDLAFWGLLGFVLFATIVSRFIALRDQPAGMGLDAYHHTLISQLFVEQGGIPANYFPYAPISSFTYHFGFHSFAATIGWLSGRTSVSDMMTLMPQAGQIADTLPVITLVLFAWKVLGNRWAGLAAGALAGVACIVPSFYVNWSRYTQGMGLAVLPVAWVLLLEVLDRPLTRRSRRTATAPTHTSSSAPSQDGATAGQKGQTTPDDNSQPSQVTWQTALRQSGPYMLAVVGAAGLALTHYRIVIIYAAFVALYLAWRLWRSVRQRVPLLELAAPLRRTATVAVLAGAAMLPWLINLRQNFHENVLDKPSTNDSCKYYDVPVRLGADIINSPTLAIVACLSLGGIAWAIKRKDILPLLPAITWAILTAWSSPCWWPLPYDFAVHTLKMGYLDVVTVLSAVWLPLCLLAGYTLVRFAAWFISPDGTWGGTQRRVWSVVSTMALGLVVVVGGLALGYLLGPPKDDKPYMLQGDAQALKWMHDNLPRDSYVLAEPFGFGWSPESVLGTDSGVWIPLVAGVQASVPPMTAYNERLADPGYLIKMRQLVGAEPLPRPAKDGPTTADWDALKRAGVTHLYIGSRSFYFDKKYLFDHPEHATLVYHGDDTWLFALK